MDVWEALVQEYLCLDRRLFVSPQYDVGEKVWHARLDFLALDFGARTVWMVEVSTSTGNLYGKTSEFVEEYIPRIREQLVDSGFLIDNGWSFKLWLFCSEAHHSKLLIHKDKCGVEARVTSLVHVAATMLNGDAWKERRDPLPERQLLKACI